MDSKMSKEIQKETIMQDIKKETEQNFLFSNEEIHDYEEEKCRFIQQNIKTELDDEIICTLNEQMDLVDTNDITYRTDANEFHTPVEQIYIKEEFEHAEEVKKENENNDSLNNEYTCNEQEDTKEDIDANQHFIEYPEVNMDVTKMSILQDTILCKGKKKYKEAFTTGQLKCDECNKHFSTAGNLQRHNKVIHNRITQYKCQECSKTFAMFKELKNHIRVLHEKEKYNCKECNQYFFKPLDLKIHVKVQHKLQCKQCNKSFCNVGSLSKHVKAIHDGIKNYVCQKCNKKYSRLSYLKNHIVVVHKRIKKFRCEECKKSFFYFKNLKYHMLTVHLRLRNCECYECGKRFFQLAHLKSHISAVHVRLRRFECHECNITFSALFSLKKHITNKHLLLENYKEQKAIKINECEICHKTFSLFDQCKMHMFVMHGKV